MKTTINLHQKLKQYNEAVSTREEDLILKEAAGILNNAEQADLSALNNAGLFHTIGKASSINNERQNLLKYEEVYDISAIKKMAIDYNLRFLPSELYKGNIDPVLPSKIRAFTEKHNITKRQAS